MAKAQNDFVKRGDLISYVCDWFNNCVDCPFLGCGGTSKVCQFKLVVNEVTAVDAVPVKHGYWDWFYTSKMELHNGHFEYTPVFSCSVCGHRYESYRRYYKPRGLEDADFPNFCENCGAKMEGAKDGTD